MATVLNDNFTDCKMTPDGMFFVTDNKEVLPVKKSHLDLRSSFYTNYDAYKSEHSDTVNVEAKLSFAVVNVSGSYR